MLWVLHYCLDDESLIPLLDIRNLKTHICGAMLEVRNGIQVGPRGMSFGGYFSADSPHPNANVDKDLKSPFSSETKGIISISSRSSDGVAGIKRL